LRAPKNITQRTTREYEAGEHNNVCRYDPLEAGNVRFQRYRDVLKCHIKYGRIQNHENIAYARCKQNYRQAAFVHPLFSGAERERQFLTAWEIDVVLGISSRATSRELPNMQGGSNAKTILAICSVTSIHPRQRKSSISGPSTVRRSSRKGG
jgi:hypothetical protein